jgi:hypothetical protein
MEFIVGFSRSRSPWKLGSTAIQLAEKRDYGHAYVKFFGPLTKKPLIAQASHGSVNMMALPVFLENNIVVKEYSISCSDEEFLDIMNFICDHLGLPYSQTEIILIAIKKIIRLQLKTYNTDKYFICSKFADMICGFVGVQSKVELDYITPSDLDTTLAEAMAAGNERIKLLPISA